MSDESQTNQDIAPRQPSAAESVFQQRMGAFVGPRWESAYRRKLAVFMDDPSFVPTWNWSAALALPFWFLYRKMYWWFAVFFFLPGAVLDWLVPTAGGLTPEAILKPENRQVVYMLFAVQISSRLAAGGVANWLLFRRANTAIRVVGMQPMNDDDATQLLRRVGGTSRSLTFALLGVFLVLGIASVMGTVTPTP